MKPRKFEKDDRPFKKFRRDADPAAAAGDTRDKPYKPAFRGGARPDRHEFGEELLYAASGKVAEVVGTMPLDRHEVLRRMWRYYMQEGLVKPLPGGPRIPRDRDERPERGPRESSPDRPRTFDRGPSRGPSRGPREFTPRSSEGARRFSREGESAPRRFEPRTEEGPRRFSREGEDRPKRFERRPEGGSRPFTRSGEGRPRTSSDGPRPFTRSGPGRPRTSSDGPRPFTRSGPSRPRTSSPRTPTGKHPTARKSAMIDKAPRRKFKETREPREG